MRRPELLAGIFAAVLATAPVAAFAQNDQAIRIGFSLALIGPLAPNGKQALLGAKIWQEDVNAKVGLLGRKVELVNYCRPSALVGQNGLIA